MTRSMTPETQAPTMSIALPAIIVLALLRSALDKAIAFVTGGKSEQTVDIEVPVNSVALAKAQGSFVNYLLNIGATKLVETNPNSVFGWTMLWATLHATGKTTTVTAFCEQVPVKIRADVEAKIKSICDYFEAAQYTAVPVGSIAIAVLNNALRVYSGNGADDRQITTFSFTETELVGNLAAMRHYIGETLEDNGDSLNNFANLFAISGTTDGNGIGMFLTLTDDAINEPDVLMAALNTVYTPTRVEQPAAEVLALHERAPIAQNLGDLGRSLNPAVHDAQRAVA